MSRFERRESRETKESGVTSPQSKGKAKTRETKESGVTSNGTSLIQQTLTQALSHFSGSRNCYCQKAHQLPLRAICAVRPHSLPQLLQCHW